MGDDRPDLVCSPSGRFARLYLCYRSLAIWWSVSLACLIVKLQCLESIHDELLQISATLCLAVSPDARCLRDRLVVLGYNFPMTSSASHNGNLYYARLPFTAM